MSEPEKYVAAGVGSPAQTVGLHGLVPFDIVQPPAVMLRPGRGIVRLHLELPVGIQAQPGAPLACRVRGWSAGLVWPDDGRIRHLAEPRFPVELPYVSRTNPEPPEVGELVVDISFRYLREGVVGIQDVQWRQRITWGASGASGVDLHYTLPG